ncbi:MAG: sulfotransferase family 2 domain-containing protein [Opitutales bacterium]
MYSSACLFMKISHQHRFIFIHIPKTAGSSVAKALEPFSHHAENLPVNRLLSAIGINVNWLGPLEWRRGRKHTNLREVQRMLPREVFESYFKFAFVRNPWDLMVSYYHYIASRPQHHRSKMVQQLPGFPDYLHYEIKRNKISQSQFVFDAEGNQLVDFVGRFESLANDFDQICRKVGIEAQIPHVNKSAHKDFREYYDDETKALVAQHWAADIERFGYTFD